MDTKRLVAAANELHAAQEALDEFYTPSPYSFDLLFDGLVSRPRMSEEMAMSLKNVRESVLDCIAKDFVTRLHARIEKLRAEIRMIVGDKPEQGV